MSLTHPDNLDEALWRHGALSQLARLVGCSVSHLCDIRKGRAVPSPALAQAIADETGIPVDTLMRKTEA